MTRILVCQEGYFRYFSPISLEPYIEMFINALIENGNEVMPYLLSDLNHTDKRKDKRNKDEAFREIKKFNPEVIFSFNHVIDERFLKELDCPIFIMEADTPVFWKNKDLILKYNDRYTVFYLNEHIQKELKEDLKIRYERQFPQPVATDIKAVETIQNKDITFIGNFLLPQWSGISSSIVGSNVNITQKEIVFKKMLSDFEKNDKISDSVYEEYKNIFGDLSLDKDKIESSFCLIFTNYKRQELLNNLVDLDLHIYTTRDTLRCYDFNYKLFQKCHFNSISSCTLNQKIYNETKISLTLPHHQVKTAFSWRVCDILASNSMLLANPTISITKIFGDLIPTYTTKEELRDKCLYYLKNENERLEIVKKCNEVIQTKHRFYHQFQKFEEYTGIKFINPNSKGVLINIKRVQKRQDKFIKKNPNFISE